MKYFLIALLAISLIAQPAFAGEQPQTTVEVVLNVPALTEKPPAPIKNNQNSPTITNARVMLDSDSATFIVTTDVPTKFSLGYRTEYFKVKNKNVGTEDFMTERVFTLSSLQPATVYAFDITLTDANGRKKGLLTLFLKTSAAGELPRSIEIPIKKPLTAFSLRFGSNRTVYEPGKVVEVFWNITDRGTKDAGPISCQASGNWNGIKDGAFGSHREKIQVWQNGDYSMTCSRGETTLKETIRMTLKVGPEMSLMANKTEIAYDEPVSLSWQSSGAAVCKTGSIEFGSFANVASLGKENYGSSGSTTIYPRVSGKAPTKKMTKNYSVTCFTEMRCADKPFSCNHMYTAKRVSVDVLPTPFITFSAITEKRNKKERTATLSWSAPRAVACSASQGWEGSKAISGTEKIVVKEPTAFRLDCTTSDGIQLKKIVNVK